jgi:23S rRNA pseudouridine2605 synthase
MPRPRSNKSTRKGFGTSFGKRSDAEKSFRKKGPSSRSESEEKRNFSKPSGYRKSNASGSFRPSDSRKSDDDSYSARPRRDGASKGKEDFKQRQEGPRSFSKPFRTDGDWEKKSPGKDFASGSRPYRADSKRPFNRDSDSPESSSRPSTSKRSGDFKPSFRKDSGFRKRTNEKGPYKAGGADRGKRPFHKERDDSSFTKSSPRADFKNPVDEVEAKTNASDFTNNNPDKKSFRKEERKSFVQSRVGISDFTRPNRKAKEETAGEDSGKEKGFLKKEKYSKEREETQSTESVSRLNKYIANSGVGSRRDADKLITMGLISVNGVTITELGTKVKAGDVVRYEDRVLKAEKPVYILLNKPKGFITTTDDPQERNTVMGLVAGACKERIYPVGRLDRNTTGLLLLTNDGDLADKLTHPSYKAKKVYKVELDKPLTKNDFQKILDGVRLEEGKAMVDDLAVISDDNKSVGLEIHIGWNRVVRRIFESLGYVVVKLDRSVYAGLDKKDTPRGNWRFLKPEEIVMLKHFK